MKRTLELRLKIPEIDLNYWMPTDQDALTFPFREGNLKGVISLNLDPEAVDYDYVEDVADRLRKVPLSCSQVVLRIEGECDDEVTDEEFLEIAQALTAKYLNDMLSYIRTELGQYWGSLIRISEWGLNEFLLQANAKWVDERGETEVLQEIEKVFAIPLPSDFYYRSLGLDKTRWGSISRYIQERPDRDLTKILMANAKQHFEDGDYRMAAVEAVAALEVKLPRFFIERCKSRGVLGDSGASLPSKPQIGYCLILLRLILPEQELDVWLHVKQAQFADSPLLFSSLESDITGKGIVDACIKLNTIRNKVVHERKIPQQEDIKDIKRGIEAVEWLLNFIRDVGGGVSH